MLYYLTPAIQPRMLVTFDEDLSPLCVNVRVGQVREEEREKEKTRESERERLNRYFMYDLYIFYAFSVFYKIDIEIFALLLVSRSRACFILYTACCIHVSVWQEVQLQQQLMQ